MLATGQKVEVKLPLPPEGQKGVHIAKSKVLFQPRKDKEPEAEPDWSALANPVMKNAEHWRPGWYLFASNSLASSAERLQSMARPIHLDMELRLFREEWMKAYRQNNWKLIEEMTPNLREQAYEDTAHCLEVYVCYPFYFVRDSHMCQ